MRPTPPLAHSELGVDATGTDGRGADTHVAKFLIDGARESDLGELAGTVDGLTGEPVKTRLTGNSDQIAPVACLDHVRQPGAVEVDGAHCICFHHLDDVLPRRVEKSGVVTYSGVGDQNLNAAEVLVRQVEQTLDIGGARDIGGGGDRAEQLGEN